MSDVAAARVDLPAGPRLVVAPTGQLTGEDLRAARDLLEAAFADGFGDDDWDHCLGGLHALLWSGPTLLAHGALVQRQLRCAGRWWRTGWVEGVGVRTEARRGGHGAAVMAALERLARPAYDLVALSSTEEGRGFYAARGWRGWQGATWALTTDGVVRTPDDDDAVHVLQVPPGVDLSGDLVCDAREGDPW